MMFGLLPNPWMILAVLALLGGAFGAGHHQAYVEQEARIGKLNEKARSLENEIAEQATNKAYELKKQQDEANNQISRLKSDIATGELRLSIASSVPMPSASGASAGAGAETRCELDRAAAQRIVAVPADGDAGIRQLNALIDFYNDTRTKMQKGIK